MNSSFTMTPERWERLLDAGAGELGMTSQEFRKNLRVVMATGPLVIETTDGPLMVCGEPWWEQWVSWSSTQVWEEYGKVVGK